MKKVFIYLVILLLTAFAGNAHAADVGDALSSIDIHGFVSQGYITSKDNNYLANDSSDGTFALNEIGINFSKQLTDKLRIGLQLFSNDLGAIGNNKIILDWAFADYRWKDWLGIRVGKIKAPHGFYNEGRDMDMLRTSIFLPQSVYTETTRDFSIALSGVGFYGEVPENLTGAYSYYLLAGTNDIDGDESSGIIRRFNSIANFEVAGDADVGDFYIGNLEWQTPLDGLRFNGTFKRVDIAFPALFGGTLDATYDIHKLLVNVYSVEYTWNDMILAAEYMRSRFYNKITVPAIGMSQESISKSHGYYISATYRFNDWFEAGTYYSKAYANSDDKDGSDGVAAGTYVYDYQAWLDDIALSLRFDINEYWVAKLEGHLMDGAAGCLGIDNTDYEEDWYMVAAKMSFSF